MRDSIVLIGLGGIFILCVCHWVRTGVILNASPVEFFSLLPHIDRRKHPKRFGFVIGCIGLLGGSLILLGLHRLTAPLSSAKYRPICIPVSTDGANAPAGG